jgi:hypothetical protein
VACRPALRLVDAGRVDYFLVSFDAGALGVIRLGFVGQLVGSQVSVAYQVFEHVLDALVVMNASVVELPSCLLDGSP